MLGDVEGALEVDTDDGCKCPGIVLRYGGSGAGNARIVDQDVQPAELVLDVGKQPDDGVGIDVGDVDPRTAGSEGLGNGQADPVGSLSDKDSLWLGHDVLHLEEPVSGRLRTVAAWLS